MITRIIKRIQIEKCVAYIEDTKPLPFTAIVQAEWFKFWLRRRATRYAI